MENNKNISILDFIDSLNVSCPPADEFLKLSKILPMHPMKNAPLNYERGILLYKLIKILQPSNILEIGRAEGYSTMCMARALFDSKIDGKIFSIDPKSIDKPIDRLKQWDVNEPNKIIKISTKDLWNKFCGDECIDKVKIFSGYSGEVFNKNNKNFPTFDFIYLDGHYAYEAIEHDFHVSLRHASKNFHILFMGYKSTGGIGKFIDKNIIPKIAVTIIHDTNRGVSLDKIKNHLVLLSNDSIGDFVYKIFPKSDSDKIIKNYLKWEKRWKFRNKVNSSIPFLSKISFKNLFSS